MKEKLKKEKERKIKQKSHIALHTSHNSGITLVALIITIIVLLILAVVAIRAVQGDGIIQHAKNAATGYEQAQADEEQKLLELEYQMAKENGSFTGTFKDYLLKKEYDKKVADGTFTGTYDEYLVSKYSLGAATNVENYGKKVVGYTSKGEGLSNLVWRIFYQDDKNVYLISETTSKNCPVNNLFFYNYGGSSSHTKKDIVEKYNSGADVSIQGKSLMPKASSLFTTENTNPNIIATAYMCDPEVWDGYKDSEGKAEYAMGGPTIELFVESYNACNLENTITLLTNTIGYTNSNANLNTDQKNGIYRLNTSEWWWQASPCGVNGSTLSMYTSGGDVSYDSLYVGNSARPIVCISVSNFDYELAD